MPRSPVIGSRLRVLHEKGLPADLARNRAYFDALESAGGTPLGISSSLSEPRLRALFDLCDGLCLPGGPDVEPLLYGEATRADCAVEVDNELDRAEMLLASWALETDKPVLAICRGAQVLNVALGGRSGRTSARRVRPSTTTPRTARGRSSRTTSTWRRTRGCTPSPARSSSMSTACITRRCATLGRRSGGHCASARRAGRGRGAPGTPLCRRAPVPPRGAVPRARLGAPAVCRFRRRRACVTAEPDADRSHRRLWVGAIAVIAALVVVRNLVDLSGSPPGLYVDEASIGYNAWTIAHFGVDEHGIHFPLFFEAFGEYKNPIYVYAVAALVRFLPLTVAVERFPAALFGLAVVGFLTAAAWRMTGSRLITLGTLALTAFTPWLVIESRVGFETISLVALLSAALWCLAGRQPTARQFGIAGVFLALAIYGYTTARLEVLLIAIALAIAWGPAQDARLVAGARPGRRRVRRARHLRAAQPGRAHRALHSESASGPTARRSASSSTAFSPTTSRTSAPASSSSRATRTLVRTPRSAGCCSGSWRRCSSRGSSCAGSGAASRWSDSSSRASCSPRSPRR